MPICFTIDNSSGELVMVVTTAILFGRNLEDASVFLKPAENTGLSLGHLQVSHGELSDIRGLETAIRSHECHHYSVYFSMKSHKV